MFRRIIILVFSVFYAINLFCTELSADEWSLIEQSILQGNDVNIPLLLEMKEELENEEMWDEDDKLEYLKVISYLAEFASRKGHFAEEESYLKDGMHHFNDKDWEANSPYTRRLWLSMTKLQKDIGNIGALLDYGHQALWMYEDVQDYGYDYVLLLNNISLGYFLNRDLLSSKLYIDEAIDRYEALIQDNLFQKDISYYYFLNMKGLVALELNHFEEAEEVLNVILQELDETDTSLTYYRALQNLASLYIRTGDYCKARELIESINPITLELSIYKNENLAILDYFTLNRETAIQNISNYNDDRQDELFNVVSAFSETEREPYLKRVNQELIFANNLLADKFPEISEECFNANLFGRSISLVLNQIMNEGTNESKASNDLMEQINFIRNEINRQGVTTEVLDSLHRELIDKEKFLLRSTHNLSTLIIDRIGNWQKIKPTLREGDAMVMFCYVPEMSDFYNGTNKYGAYIATANDSMPTLIKLCSVNSLEDFFYKTDPSIEFIQDLYSKEISNEIYQSLWEPLEEHLAGAKKIFYSTCGTLNLINHEALVDNDGFRQGMNREMIYVSSPSLIGETENKSLNVIRDITLIGNPDFNLSAKEMQTFADNLKKSTVPNVDENILSLRGEIMRDGWSALPGTKEEIETIIALFPQDKENIKSFTGSEALEETVKSMNGNSPQILHFATHGFVISNALQYDNSQFAKSITGINERSTYMLWSGLLLSGSNNIWTGKDIPKDIEDGVLTAEEISRLNLSNTKLVVLSACDTGKGHIDSVEGVWGLQRAFKQAGVESILMTLWKIPDSTTAMFMEQFYSFLLNGYSPRQSLKKAQQYFIHNGVSDPFYWASFIILD